MSDSGYCFYIAKWSRDADAIRTVREEVLLKELNLPATFISEEQDPEAFHILVTDANYRVVGTARMQKNGIIDYVTVLKPWRGNTVGGALLSYLRHIAQATKLEYIQSNVIDGATKFFVKNGFEYGDKESAKNDIHRYLMLRQVSLKPEKNEVLH